MGRWSRSVFEGNMWKRNEGDARIEECIYEKAKQENFFVWSPKWKVFRGNVASPINLVDRWKDRCLPGQIIRETDVGYLIIIIIF